MMTIATAMKSMLVVAIAVTASGSAAERPFDCCTEVGRAEITEPILGFYFQQQSKHCVLAIIFQTDRGYQCSSINEGWVKRKIRELRKQKRASTISLLKLIASSSPPPSTAPTSST